MSGEAVGSRFRRTLAADETLPVDVRAVGPEDTDLIVRMRLAFLSDHRATPVGDFPADFVRRTRAFVDGGLRGATLPSWVVEDDTDGCVGAVSMLLVDVAPHPVEPSDREGYVLNMYVRPAERRRGYGRLLLESCLEHARVLDLRRVYLFATAAGRPLYESTGFAPNGDWMEVRPRRGA